ncbi:MAG: shikimate kinase [Planctomycetia bacterium]|nr:shikimate kinase [Planctomycetia bacterium]
MMISFIGYRATGKTTLGRELAQRLDYRFIDSDAEIERLAGKSIASIFAEDGELYFRDMEEKIIGEICGQDGIILATGGGAVMREVTRKNLQAAGPVIWLTASAETIFRRMAADVNNSQTRPNLTSQGGLDEIRQLMAVREPFYRSLATLTVETENFSPQELIEQIFLEISHMYFQK